MLPLSLVRSLPLAALVAVAIGCGARDQLPVGAGGTTSASSSAASSASSSAASSASSTSSTSSTSSSSSSGTGTPCTNDAQCGCLFNCCNGQCVNEANDILNCGGCGNACPGPHPYCENGTCATPPCDPDAGTCGAGSVCCGSTCCAPGQLCCTLHAACCDFTACHDPVDGTCPVGNPCTTCASPDTPIATPGGDRAIASLVPGDLVYSVEDEAVVVVPVAETGKTRASPGHRVVEVTLESGAVLRISPGHPTADGRTFADLAPGDRLGEAQVTRVRRVLYEGEHTYDILPASRTHAYFAAGALIGTTLGR